MAAKMAKKYRTSYSETSQSKEKSEKAESAWGSRSLGGGERSEWGEKRPETRWGARSDWERDKKKSPKRRYGW